MPDFTPDDISVDPDEFVSSCNSREIKELIEVLIEDGHIEPSQTQKNLSNGIRRPNVNDDIFSESIDVLGKCRDLLSLDEENYINKLAEKFKHLR